MITKEVNKFMALAPLMLPRLIDSKKCAEPDITEDSAILYFSLEEKFPIGCVMDMLDDDMDLLLLYHGTSKTASNIHHCCSLPVLNWVKVCTRSIWCHSLTALLMESP